MPRVLALLLLIGCLSAPAVASDLVFSSASNIKPGATLNFDGSRHMDISHNRQQEQKQESNVSEDTLTFEKSDSVPNTLVLVGVGLVAAAAGVAVKVHDIAKGSVAVH